MSNSTIIANSSKLVNSIIENNRFSNVSIGTNDLNSTELKGWKSLFENLHKAAYSVYEYCENNNLLVESSSVDKSEVYAAIRPILAEFGMVNGHKMLANEELATLIIGYSGKRANSDSPELQFCLSCLKNRKDELKQYEETAGVNPEAVQAKKDEIAELEARKDELLSKPDNRIKAPTRTSANAFRLDVEHRLARAIANQQAMSWDELEARDAERKKSRSKKSNKKSN